MSEQDGGPVPPRTTPGAAEPAAAPAPTQSPPPAPTATPTPVAPKQPVKTPPAIAERIKAWGDAATALLKALLLALTIVAAGVVVGSAIWRDDPSRQLEIHVDGDADKTLRLLGSDLDLRQTLIDSLNDGLHGVAQIVAFQGLGDIVASAQADAFSFKPFGLDLSTTDITRMIREVRGSPPSMAARIDLVCAPRPCTEAGATEGSLVVTVSDSEGSRRVSYPVPLVNPGLRRGLHQAMERSADLILERTRPLVAGVLYLNRWPLFLDQRRNSLERAERAVLQSRGAGAGAGGSSSCMEDLVIGGSLIGRYRWPDGIAAETRAGQSASSTCQIHAATNVVFMLFGGAVCDPLKENRDFAHEQSRQALARMPVVEHAKVGDLVYKRIPTSRLQLQIEDVLDEPANDRVREAFCRQAISAPSDIGASLVERIRIILEQMQKTMPPTSKPQSEEHGLLNELRALLNLGTPESDLAGRWLTGAELDRAIDAYLLTDRHPRRLFLIQGQLAIDMAWAAHATLLLEPAKRQAAVEAALERTRGGPAPMAKVDSTAMLQNEIALELNKAQVAFENAAGTESAGSLVEPAPSIEPLTALGDDLVAAGGILGARDAYGRAVDAFIEDGVPVDQILRFADTVTRWSVLRIAGGACQKDEPADPSWEQRWARLGGGAHDVCGLGQPDKTPAQPSLFAIIRPLVAAGASRCLPKAGMPPDWAADRERRFELLECLRTLGQSEQDVLTDFFSHQSGAMVSAEIDRALSRRP